MDTARKNADAGTSFWVDGGNISAIGMPSRKFRWLPEQKGILNRAQKMRWHALTRAFGAASPATKRARRIIGRAERHILTRSLTFDPLPSGEGISCKKIVLLPISFQVTPTLVAGWR